MLDNDKRKCEELFSFGNKNNMKIKLYIMYKKQISVCKIVENSQRPAL